MNVLFLTSSFPRHAHDSQVPFVLEQALAWKKACPEDSLFILAPHDTAARREETIGNIRIFRFPYWIPLKWQKLAYPAILPNIRRNPFLMAQVPFFLLSEWWTTLTFIRRFKIDLIFAHWVMPQGLAAYICQKVLGTPYGLTNHSSDLRIFHKIPLIGRPLARRIIKNAVVMFCQNKQLKHEALHFFREENRPSMDRKIISLSMGVFQASEPPAPDVPRHAFYDFGFIGRLSQKKGIHFFLTALRKLQEQGIAFKAAVAGEGEEADQLKAMAQGIPVDFVGHLSGQTKLDFFNNVRIFVFPSHAVKNDIEGLPVALLEALYLGKTVIASKDTNIQLLPEWNKIHKEIYFLSDPQDIGNFTNILNKAFSLSDPEAGRRSEIVRKAFQRYKWDHLIKEHLRYLKCS